MNVKDAARENSTRAEYNSDIVADAIRQAVCETTFIADAIGQAMQSPWISVEEQLPETNDGQSLYEVIVATSDRRFQVVINTEVEHLVGLLGVTHWMSIPKFND